LDFLKNEARINDSPTPGNAAVKGAPVAWMKNFRIRFGARVSDHIDGGRVVLICQVPAIDKD
jgi:hypothetical protein